MKSKLTKEELERLYWKEELPQAEIGEKLGIDASTVGCWMKKYGVPTRPSNHKRKIHFSKTKLRELYWKRKLSLSKTAQVFGVTASTVQSRMKEYGIPRRKATMPKKQTKRQLQKVKVVCASCGRVFEKCSCRVKERKNHFCSHKCHSWWDSLERIIEEKYNAPLKELLYVYYWGKNMRLEQMADVLETNAATLSKYMKRYGIALKPRQPPPDILYRGRSWIKQRERARKRDNYSCQKCGIKESKLNRELLVHHIIPLREFKPREYKEAHNLSNLITLCIVCHKKMEEW